MYYTQAFSNVQEKIAEALTCELVFHLWISDKYLCFLDLIMAPLVFLAVKPTLMELRSVTLSKARQSLHGAQSALKSHWLSFRLTLASKSLACQKCNKLLAIKPRSSQHKQRKPIQPCSNNSIASCTTKVRSSARLCLNSRYNARFDWKMQISIAQKSTKDGVNACPCEACSDWVQVLLQGDGF